MERRHVAEEEPATPKKRTSPQYPRIASDLREAIKRDDYKHGAQLPSESQLMDQYDVSRPTAHRALVELESEGLLEIKHGKGAFVRNWPPILRNETKRLRPEAHQDGRSMWDEETAGRSYSVESDPVQHETAPEFVAQDLGTSDVQVRRRRHIVDGRPVMLSTSYYPAAIVEGSQITEANTGPGGSPARLDELGHGPRSHTVKFRPRMPTEQERKDLQLPLRGAVSEFTRISRDRGGQAVEVTVMIAAGDAFIHQFDITS